MDEHMHQAATAEGETVKTREGDDNRRRSRRRSRQRCGFERWTDRHRFAGRDKGVHRAETSKKIHRSSYTRRMLCSYFHAVLRGE